MSSNNPLEHPIEKISRIRDLINPLFIPSLIFRIIAGVLIPVLPIFVLRDLHGNEVTLGLLVATTPFAKGIMNVPNGYIIQKFGFKLSMLFCSFVSTVAPLIVAFSPSIISAFLFQILFSISMSIFTIGRQAFVAEYVFNEKRGRVMSILGGSGRVAQIIGPLLGGLLAKYFSITIIFMVLSMLSMIFGIWVTFGFQDQK